MPLTVWIRRLAFTGLVLCFVVVVLGAYVRLSAAGLSCPDWPGCYGAPTPLGLDQDAAAQARFLDSMTAWVGKARAAGLGPDDIEAIYRTAIRTGFAEGVA